MVGAEDNRIRAEIARWTSITVAPDPVLERFGEKFREKVHCGLPLSFPQSIRGLLVFGRRPNLLFIVYTSPKVWEFSDRQRVSE